MGIQIGNRVTSNIKLQKSSRNQEKKKIEYTQQSERELTIEDKREIWSSYYRSMKRKFKPYLNPEEEFRGELPVSNKKFKEDFRKAVASSIKSIPEENKKTRTEKCCESKERLVTSFCLEDRESKDFVLQVEIHETGLKNNPDRNIDSISFNIYEKETKLPISVRKVLYYDGREEDCYDFIRYGKDSDNEAMKLLKNGIGNLLTGENLITTEPIEDPRERLYNLLASTGE